MRKYVFEIREDIYQKHGKTEQNVAELLKILPNYGTVEDYDSHIATVCKKHNEVIEYLKSEVETIKSYGVTDEELALLVTHRTAKEKAVKSEKDRNAVLEQALVDQKKIYQDNINKIKAVIPNIDED